MMFSAVFKTPAAPVFPFLLLALVSLPATPASGQSDDGIVIAVPDRFPDVNGQPYALVLGETGRTVVLIRSDRLTPPALEAALRLARRESELPPPAGQASVRAVTGFAVRRPLREKRSRDLAEVIRALHSAPRTSLGSVGSGRWVLWGDQAG